MNISQDLVNNLVAHPSEGLNVEIKRWIDPTSSEGIAKIAKGAIALRNRNGGYFVVGFDDDTLLPDQRNSPSDVRRTFHVDVIQGIISKYASIPFEVQVAFAVRAEQEFPVIVVPTGTTVPVACKKDLKDTNGKLLLREDGIYFRTLRSNGTPSSSLAKASDWRDIIEICFENREADIGRFLRRHLGGETALSGMISAIQPGPTTLEERARQLLSEVEQHRDEALKEAGLDKKVHELGSWSVLLVMTPPREPRGTDADFLNTIATANPQYTGWPVWLDSRGFTEKSSRPRRKKQAWEALIANPGRGFSSHFDYYRMDPKGVFYLWRALQDDMTEKVEPRTALDPALMLYRIIETIAVGLSFAKALKYHEDATLGFLFKWTGLKGRTLESWANRAVFISDGREAYDDVVEAYVEIPATTPLSAIAPYVDHATQELFTVFDGFRYPVKVIEDRVQRLLARKL
ncbi:ATP-binding protein [Microvirga lenta]|uniref:ATP-binding protein n=1 Tax=Microvirga lenta TaxID=2881337 RepID=UPI001CFF7D1D|nr:ATP-binding protein [Microvirga lenta]MCB5175228.1 ATP-binding protein [Microvirga lenta]